MNQPQSNPQLKQQHSEMKRCVACRGTGKISLIEGRFVYGQGNDCAFCHGFGEYSKSIAVKVARDEEGATIE